MRGVQARVYSISNAMYSKITYFERNKSVVCSFFADCRVGWYFISDLYTTKNNESHLK